MNLRKAIREAFDSSKFFDILKQLGKVFTSTPLHIDEVKVIRYRPIVRSGKIKSIMMQDSDSSFGGIETYFKESDAQEINLSLEEVVRFLEENGARPIQRTRRRAMRGSYFPD